MAKAGRTRDAAPSETIGASEFKRRCLELLDRVRDRGTELVVTKRGEPVARVTPIRRGGSTLRGIWRDQIAIRGDIVHVDWTDDWEAAR